MAVNFLCAIDKLKRYKFEQPDLLWLLRKLLVQTKVVTYLTLVTIIMLLNVGCQSQSQNPQTQNISVASSSQVKKITNRGKKMGKN